MSGYDFGSRRAKGNNIQYIGTGAVNLRRVRSWNRTGAMTFAACVPGHGCIHHLVSPPEYRLPHTVQLAVRPDVCVTGHYTKSQAQQQSTNFQLHNKISPCFYADTMSFREYSVYIKYEVEVQTGRGLPVIIRSRVLPHQTEVVLHSQ